jgi:hypothetical protein
MEEVWKWKKINETLGRKELKGKRKGRQKERERRAFERENGKEEE